MFLGHFAAALASKKVAPGPSLGWFFAACQFPDLLWPILVLAGIERVSIDPGNTAFTPLSFDHYPWSHSLGMVVLWGVLLGGLYVMLRKDRRGALIVAGLVVSHWLLDWITHRPDLPLLPGGTAKYGLGLWNSVPATLAIELAFFIGAVVLYTGITVERERTGRIGFWVLIAFLLGIHLANAFGPPPPSANMVAASALALWVLLPIAAWVDRTRVQAV